MVSMFVFLIFVGTAVFTNGNGWEIGKEYMYIYKSRTLTTLDEGNDAYTGLTYRGVLTIQPKSNDQLIVKITNASYTRIHQSFPDETEIDMEVDALDYQKLPISESPFGINLRNGLVNDLFVNKSMPTWELNILKSIVSQMQVSGRGENMVRSKRNAPQEDGLPTAFSAMEETVTGKCEVFYSFTPLPTIYSTLLVTKTKNFSNCERRMMYHFGFSGRNDFQLGSSENENYFSRASESQIIIDGNLKNFLILSSETTENISQQLNIFDSRRGKVLSKVHLFLKTYNTTGEPLKFVPGSRRTGSLVYDYNSPTKNDRNANDQDYLQPKPTLPDAPEIPLLPYFIGNGGHSLLHVKQIDLTLAVFDLCNKIGDELVNPSIMMKEETLEKITILTRLLRTMHVPELTYFQDNFFRSEHGIDLENKQRLSDWNRWVIFRNAVAQAGTGPALVVIKSWITRKMITGQEAAEVVSILSKTARIPTPEFVRVFFGLIRMDVTLNDDVLHRAAVLAFADLLRESIEKSARYRYPVYTFGNFTLNDTAPVIDEYLQYLAAKLKEAVERGESADIQTFTSAIARVNHPKTLKILEPYLENSLLMSKFQRAWLVLSLNKFTTSWPSIARPILYKIYRDTDDQYEVRCAAVFVLMMTNPPESVLKDMANFTNYDPSDHVSSAVKASIISAVDNGNDSELNRKAQRAAPLLTPRTFEDKYSKNVIMNYTFPKTNLAFNQYIHMLGSDDSKWIKSIYAVSNPRWGSLEVPTQGWGASVSSLEPLIRALTETFRDKKKNGPESGTKKWTAENIARVLKVAADEDQKFEGNVFSEDTIHSFMPFDGSLLDKIPRMLKDTIESLKQRLWINKVSYKDHNIELSFPTESGFPYVFTFEAPTVDMINIKSRIINDKTAENKSFPYTADFHAEMELSHAVKMQGRSGFVTPFDNTHYMAGFDAQFQLYLPLQLEVKYNLQDNRYGIKMQPLDQGETYRLVQIQHIPFISPLNMSKLDAAIEFENTQIIKDDVKPISRPADFGILVETEINRPSVQTNQETLEKKIQKPSKSLLQFWKLAIVWTSDPWKNESVKLDIIHDSIRNSSTEYGDSSSWIPNAKDPEMMDRKVDSKARRQYLLNEAIKSINFGKADVFDVGLELEGRNNYTFVSTVAYGTSDVDIKSRLLCYLAVDYKQYEVYGVTGGIEFKSPCIPALDPGKMLKSNLSMEFDAKLTLHDEVPEIFKLHGSVGRSQERQNELLAREEARDCLKEYEAGNSALIACDNITALADFYDQINVTVNLEEAADLKDHIKQLSSDFGRVFRNRGAETNEVSPRHKDENRIDYNLRITGQKGLDISVFYPTLDLEVKNLRLDDLQELFVQDKYFELKTRENELDEFASSLKTPACIVGESNVKTFDGVIYPLEMNECWHVFFTTYPQWRPSSNHNSKSPIPYNQRTSIIGKTVHNDRREFKVNLGPDEMSFYTDDSKIEIKVNDESVEVNAEKSFQRQIEEDAAFEIFATSNRSIALVSKDHEVKIEYDGKHLRIEASDLHFNSIAGLCGNYDGRLMYDLKDPSKLSFKDLKYFTQTWSLQQGRNPSVENVTEGTCLQ